MHVALADHYTVLDLVGRGAIGAVYRALDLERQKIVALKVPISAADTRFDREAHLLSTLCHPALPTPAATHVHGGRRALIMRYVPGRDLADRLARRAGPFPVRTVLDWADQVLDVLGYLHARGIVHHDIKPSNLKIDATGKLVLLDFGLAGDEAPCGYTASYAPPEQVCGGRTGPRSDLYALGATLYELLTRRSPPPAADRAATAMPDSTGILHLSVSAELATIVHQALALRDTDRPVSARAMRNALRRVAAAYPREEPVTRLASPVIARAEHPTLPRLAA